MRHVKTKLNNKSLAEDIVQEIFVKAFRAYDSYIYEDKEKNWLMRIAKTTLCDYFSDKIYNEISYEVLTESGEKTFENNFRDSDSVESIEEKYIQQEFINEILAVVKKMSAAEQSVFHYRFLMEYSLSETAEILGIPSGSVKSKTFYIRQKLQNEFKTNKIIEINDKNERKNIMNCKDFELYLFGYARNLKNIANKADLKNHIDSCEKCSAIVSSLQKLNPHLPEVIENKVNHVLIIFPTGGETDIGYCYCSNKITDAIAENDNKKAEEAKKLISDGKLSYEKHADKTIIRYDNEGNEYEVAIGDNIWVALKKYYSPIDYYYMCGKNFMFCKPDRDYERPSENHPNLIECRLENNFGGEVFSSLYLAMPKTAKNIHMIRGNGVIDCGEYLFAYVSRHVAEGERIVVEYTYEK